MDNSEAKSHLNDSHLDDLWHQAFDAVEHEHHYPPAPEGSSEEEVTAWKAGVTAGINEHNGY